MKNFCGAVSLVARINFDINAETLEDAKEKILDTCCLELKLQDENCNDLKEVTIQDIEWNLVNHARRGNIQESYLDDFELYETE